MSSATVVTPASPATVARRRFTVADYHQMAEAGILAEDDRVELMDGEIVEMTPIGPRHAVTVNRLTELIVLALAGTAVVSIQNPVHLADDTEPQPDLAVLRKHTRYDETHPTAEDVLLVVEVAETSATYDRDIKLPRYARAGIAEVWLVYLARRVIEQYTNPGDDQYGSKQTFAPGQTIDAQTVALSLPVSDILK